MAKEVTSKKNQNKKNNEGKASNNVQFDEKKLIIILGIVAIISIIFIALINQEKVVMTIDNINYTKEDFNMYAYMVKYDYFGIEGTELNKEVLNTQMSGEENMTIGDYLKEKTISKIKVSASILRIANENNITLNKEDLKEIEDEKKEFIERLGGENKFKQMIKKNHTTEERYIEVAKIDKLYDKIFESLYKEGKRYDLSEEEYSLYNSTYYNDYIKMKQIILLKKNVETNTFLSDRELKQKEALAYTLVEKAKSGVDFDSLIKEYSDAYEEKIKSEYYLKSDLIEELQKEIENINIGEISSVVSEENAYHIIIKETLDEEKKEDYLDSKRNDKLVQSISDNLEKIAIQKGSYYEKIAVK